jgi:hypothetical protein
VNWPDAILAARRETPARRCEHPGFVGHVAQDALVYGRSDASLDCVRFGHAKFGADEPARLSWLLRYIP